MRLNQVPIFEKLEQSLRSKAVFVISQRIDYRQNRYTLNVQRLSRSEKVVLSKSDVVRLNLLPSGSRWWQGLGWHSYVGIPFYLDNRQWVAIGAETIVQYHQKYTHPLFLAFVFPLGSQRLFDGLQDLATSINPTEKQNVIKANTGIVFSNSQNPNDHAKLEAWIIRNAAITYKKGNSPILFRTLILTEDEIRKPEYPAPNFWRRKSGFLMATIPSIQQTFSLQTKIKLLICRTWFL
ncbi:MAG: hypothetical protein D6732_23265 [Methanobacteriota archaeon]|nr:MAG: hypothetical protein D6732_23265 [Euryarchaeota archaeon]